MTMWRSPRRSARTGVHVGQSDMEAGDVREKPGAGQIIGVSAQTVEQAVRGAGARRGLSGRGRGIPDRLQGGRSGSKP